MAEIVVDVPAGDDDIGMALVLAVLIPVFAKKTLIR